MPNIRLGLELIAEGGNQTVGEINRVKKALAGNAGEIQKLEKVNASTGGGIQALAAKYYLVTQSIQALINIAKPAYEALIGQNARLQQQLIGTQSTLAATNDVFKDGVKLGDPTEAIKALEGPVNTAIEKIRKGSLELIGVTSKDLVEAFQIVAGKSGEIGIDLNQAADLTLSFSAALGTLGIPLVQARQEIQSILTGTIDQNSVLAQSLGLKNDEVRSLKEQGKLYDALTTKLSAFRAGNKLSAQTIGGISSNIQELFDEITRQAGQPLLEPLVKGLDSVFQFLNNNKDAILAFVTEGVDGFLSFAESVGVAASELGEKLQPFVAELAKVFDSDLGFALENVVNGLLKFAVVATDALLNNEAVRVFLKVADAAVQAAAAIASLNGEFGRSIEAAEIYRQQSAKVAQEAVDALKGDAKARTEAIAKIDDQLKALNESNLVGAENRAVIRSQIDELELYKQKLAGGSGAIKLVSKDTKEQTKALEEQAKAQGEALKANREKSKSQDQEGFEKNQRDRQDTFDEAKRLRDEQFQQQQEKAEEQFQRIKQTREQQFQAKQNQSQEQFQAKQQSAQELFQSKQQAAQKRFDDEQAARRDRTATAFGAAQQRASQAEQLASAQTAEERAKLAAEFARQTQQQQAIGKLQLADREFDPNQILKLAQQVSRANLNTAEGAKAVSGAIAAIQTEQQKQQEAADQQAKLAFEQQLQAQKQTFETAQQEATKTFQAQQQDKSRAFQEQQQALDKAYRDLQRDIDKAVADNERDLQRQFEEDGRSLQKTFNEQQRQADQASAEEIKKILDAAKGSGAAVTARRSGGEVRPGQPYLVGEDGPELIFPSRAGYVATAQETAAMMRGFSASFAVPTSKPETNKLESHLRELISVNRDLAARLLAQEKNVFNQTVTYQSTRSSILRSAKL